MAQGLHGANYRLPSPAGLEPSQQTAVGIGPSAAMRRLGDTGTPVCKATAMMNYTFWSATILLVLITDPIGNIPIFANALKHVAPERRPRVILREILIAFSLLLTFMFVGEGFLRVMNLSELALQIGGGVILFLIALRMVFPPPSTTESELLEEPLIVPLAVPAIAGPSALATVLLLVSQQPDRFKRFVVAGNEHTMVNRPKFFETRVADITLAQWILQLVDDDPAWADVVEQ